MSVKIDHTHVLDNEESMRLNPRERELAWDTMVFNPYCCMTLARVYTLDINSYPKSTR